PAALHRPARTTRHPPRGRKVAWENRVVGQHFPRRELSVLGLSGHERKFGDVCCAQFGLGRGARCFRTGTRSIPRQWSCDRRATKPQAKFGAALRAAVLFGPGCVARSLQIRVGYARRSRLAGAENSSPQTSPNLRSRPPRQSRKAETNMKTGPSFLTTITLTLPLALFIPCKPLAQTNKESKTLPNITFEDNFQFSGGTPQQFLEAIERHYNKEAKVAWLAAA